MKTFTTLSISTFIVVLFISVFGFTNSSEKPVALEAPIGSIIAWPGPITSIPNGWLLCNGDNISRSKYPELCQVVLNYWGPITGLNNDVHKLPDLRGVFLRGVNGSRNDNYSDPDANSRTGLKNEVGSFQEDQLISHSHLYNKPKGPSLVAQCGNCAGVMHGGFSDVSTNAIGGNETRPVNAYVNYIIKAL